MAQHQSTQTAQTHTVNDEQILVVPRNKIFTTERPVWHGLRPADDALMSTLLDHQEFQPRGAMEEDPAYKQIIPYLVFHHDGRYFLMQRSKQTREQRLKHKYSLGIGGHVRFEDIQGTDIADWAQREFHEEVSYKGDLTIEPLGILNDDSNEVGKVHLACVYLLHGTSDDICIHQELAQGWLCSLEECESYYPHMESWSQIVYNHLKHSR